MPQIDKYLDDVLGEIKITFSKKSNKFEVILNGKSYPNGFISDEHLKDWDSVERHIEKLKNYKRYNQLYVRRVIIIDLKTSIDKDEYIDR